MLPVVESLAILAHGSMPWESRTMVAVVVQGAPGDVDYLMIGSVTFGVDRTVV